ncbi:hypothetical protein [Nocardia sp. NPDC127526]|uniref:hypothetical protein n=1 Tax=Nocardia sp. NPDC127526 TaxID=3345393 RepID=UPI00363091B1
MARELHRDEIDLYEPVGTIDMALSRFGAADIHGAIDEVARAAAELGGDYFWVAESLGDHIVAEVFRRPVERR